MVISPRGGRGWLRNGAAFVLLIAGVLAGWTRVGTSVGKDVIGGGVDFAVLHATGVGIARGVNIYALNDSADARVNIAGTEYPPGVMGVIVYPPATGFVMIPFALLSYPVARILWFVLTNAVIVLGIRAAVRLAAPAARARVWMIAAGVILLSAAIRWGMMLLQGAPLVLGLLCLFAAELHQKRPAAVALIAAVTTAFKVTLALPFLGLLLLHRRFRALLVGGCAWFALNAAGFIRMGAQSFASYRRSVAAFEAVDDAHNINSPNPWSLVSLPRLDWLSLFYGLTRSQHIARAASLACAALASLWLLREGLRTRGTPSVSTTSTFLAALVCLACLSVYHHQYDLSLFFAPALLIYFDPVVSRKPSWAFLLALPLILMILLLPIGLAENVLYAMAGVAGVGLLKMMFPAAVSLALVGSLAVLRHNTDRARVHAECTVPELARPPAG